jgi:eukaryotic-like serine/threonine-protein kinase
MPIAYFLCLDLNFTFLENAMFWLKKILGELILFGVCAVFVGIVGLVVLDQVVMPQFVRQGIEVTVPDLEGLTPAEARARLSGKGLNMKQAEARWDASVPEGHIASQNPPPNSRVKPNRTVYIVPSLGGRLYAVPDVKGRPMRQASLRLGQMDIQIGTVDYAQSTKVKEGLVIQQSIPAGQEVVSGTRIDLVVSTGPPREIVDLPNLVEMKLAEARRILNALGLRSDNMRYEFSTAYEPNVVIRQEPDPGTAIKAGSNVVLYVSKL